MIEPVAERSRTDGTSMSDLPPSMSELMTVAASRALKDHGIVFAGHGLPTLAASLARTVGHSQCDVVYESGVTGAHPESMPLSISDSVLVSGAECVLSMAHLFGGMLARGRVDVGFLGAAQIDRHGSLNSTLIGDWTTPRAKLPGSGGAVEIMASAKEIYVLMRRHTRETFVDRLDFVTSPSPLCATEPGFAPPIGGGVTRVFSEYGILQRKNDELTLVAVHPGVDPEKVREATGWTLSIDPDLRTIDPPTDKELDVLRRELDPERTYLR